MRPLILIIDDDPMVVRAVDADLADRGYRVAVSNALSALERARALLPAAIVLDMLGPEGDGAEVARRLRADPLTAHIPIVAMTVAEGGRIWAAMPADAVVPKPFDLAELDAAVDRCARGA